MSKTAPTERKVKASTVATYVGSTAALLMLHGLSAEPSLVAGLPDWLEILLLPAVPGLAAYVGGYRARHTPRPDLAPQRRAGGS